MTQIKVLQSQKTTVKSGVGAIVLQFLFPCILPNTISIFFGLVISFLFDFTGTHCKINPVTVWLNSYLKNLSAIFCSQHTYVNKF